MKEEIIPVRSDIPAEDKWDLRSLYASDEQWEHGLNALNMQAAAFEQFKGKLGTSSEVLLACLKTLEQTGLHSERLGNYASLLKNSDEGDASYQDKFGRYMMCAVKTQTECSFIEPEIQSIPAETLRVWIQTQEFKNYRIFLEKLLHMKPFILSEKEERLMALQTEANETAHHTFSVLTNVDINFGTVDTPQGKRPLSQTTWTAFMELPDRNIRREAYTKFYDAYDAHKNTIASLYAGSVTVDVCQARARGYSSAREMALFPDMVSTSVYDNLIGTIRNNLGPLHRYYSLRKKALKLPELRHYDVYVPLVPDIKTHIPYAEAVETLRKALSPLGKEYTDTLCGGLTGGWVDKYENKGKRSGAFSSGGYEGYPYILMNYKNDVLRDVFTLAHEGGHSMHSHYSSAANPFMQYNYTIFEAEVASTFNEELLFRYLMGNTQDKNMKAYLTCTRASDILATLYRQTMFAEYEKRTHELVESGTPLTVDVLRSEYRSLLEAYFGAEMVFEKNSDMEGLRIPHFYTAFYVYKYATGISAALALARRVLEGGAAEKEDYFKFLKSGGSRYPLESLKIAGIDMASPEPVQAAVDTFASLVSELEDILQ